MSRSSNSWLQQQRRDPFVKLARSQDYRSRAVYKLMEIDRQDHLLGKGQTVVDLGAAPGSWSQYSSERVGESGLVIALDILPMDPIPRVVCLQGDFTDPATCQRLIEALSGRPVDLVISDIAPNLSGIRTTDQARSMMLAELTFEFSRRVLRHGGDLLIKLFQGEGADAFRKEIAVHFTRMTVRKPDASRDKSREFYMLAKGHVV
ncbi:MAG TPA: RlmE family RNA methyltransferase [Gammaproteobacteria bacterium]|nr:RlmE family RNA methyltransferase [Gammaproteobacteria bacterium]